MSSATDLTMKDKLAFFKAQKALQLQKKEENIRPNKSGIFHAKALEEGVHAKKMEEGIQRCTTIEHPTENEEEIYFLQSRMIQSPVAFTEASKLHEQHLESLAMLKTEEETRVTQLHSEINYRLNQYCLINGIRSLSHPPIFSREAEELKLAFEKIEDSLLNYALMRKYEK